MSADTSAFALMHQARMLQLFPHAHLDKKPACTYEVSEPNALIGTQDGVNLLQGLEHRGPQALRAFDAKVAALRGFGGVEGVAGQGICKCGDGAMPIDLGLGALGLELVQDLCELADLALVESELVHQEAQRAPDAKSASATAESFLKRFFARSFPGTASRTTASPDTTITESFKRTAGVPPKGWMHDHSPSRGAIRTRRGLVRVGNAPHVHVL
jgi:hypothetical protein